MSFARRVLLELTDNLTIGIITHVPTAIIQIADRRGTVNAVHQGTSQFMYKLNLRSTLSSKQIQSFNDLNYRLADLIEFSRNPLRRLAHFISISIKEKLNSAYKFATIDSCGKVYAYTGMPAYFHETRKWGGMGRRFLCRLEHNEYRGLHQTVFKINGWMIAPYDPSKRESPGISIVEKTVNTPTIHEHIQNRIKYLEDKADEISKIQSQILSLQNDVEEIQKDMANVNIEKNVLLKAAEIMGLMND